MIKPDLSGSDLSEMHLESVNFFMSELSGANFNKAILIRGNLESAELYNANFEMANLSSSNLVDAKLNGALLRKAFCNNADLRRVWLLNANLEFAKFEKCNFRGAYLFRCNLSRAIFNGANFEQATLSESEMESSLFKEANFYRACIEKSDAKFADFSFCNLANASFERTNLEGAILAYAIVVETNLSNANIEDSWIYGISAWNIKKDGFIQKNLLITPSGESEITVDDLEVAQFIYLMLNNQKIRDVIETITKKAVLILGRFGLSERKAVLDALKDELRQRDYLPIVFDFQPSASRDLTETISLLAKMSRFVVADLTDAKSIPQELSHIVPDTPSLPVLAIILKEQREYAMFEHFQRYPWVLPLHEYESPEILLQNIIPAIIAPAEQKVAELRGK